MHAKPPSEVLYETFQSYGDIPSDNVIQDVSKKVLLSPDDVLMWFKHLKQIQVNRKKGAEKAAVTRKKNRQLQVCSVCQSLEPPGDDADIDWIACDKCGGWFHVFCVKRRQIPKTWHCPRCL